MQDKFPEVRLWDQRVNIFVVWRDAVGLSAVGVESVWLPSPRP